MQSPSSSSIQDSSRKVQDLLIQVRRFFENRVDFDDQGVKNTQYQINQWIRETFGPESPEFNAHKHHNWLCSYRMKDDDSVKQRKFSEGLPKMIAMLEDLSATLEKKQSQSPSPS